MIPSDVIRAAVIFATVLGAGSGLSPSAAQESATDVGFVEAMSGRVVAFVRGSPVLVDVLDVISERTRLLVARLPIRSLLEGHASRHEAALVFRCLDEGACHRGDIDRVPSLNCYAVC
jgi:hypothetical protein